MIFKKFMDEWAWTHFVQTLYVWFPFLNTPIVREIVEFFLTTYLKPMFLEFAKVFDFALIDFEMAVKDARFRSVVAEIDLLESQDKDIEDLKPEYVQDLRDRMHGALADLIKHRSAA